jgi:hypothetical protein
VTVKLNAKTAARAKAAGVDLVVVAGEVIASKGGKVLARHLSASIALDLALEKLAKEEDNRHRRPALGGPAPRT